MLYSKVQANIDLWKVCLWAGKLSAADVCEASKRRAEGRTCCVLEVCRSEISDCSGTRLLYPLYFPFHSSVSGIWHQLVV